MVFGNLGRRSGTGVMLTRDPRHESRALHLYGDFVLQAQGEDVVSGLVATIPVTERQRLAGEGPGRRSLEADFPEIHEGLRELARVLVEQEGMNHQEVEFTFESDRASGLYVLQTRDTVAAPPAQLTAFAPDAGLEPSRIGGGIGAGGGALSGRIAHTADDIRELRHRWPEDPIVLLRRDTVPEDVPLVLQVDGLLTALGGATSHAAVAAQRLGKTCVVGCRGLDVSERPGGSTMGDHVLATGEPISIDGFDGSVYLGAHPVVRVRVGDGMSVRPPGAGGVR
jgi:pyruvate,orthophosphate dikinase